MRAATEGVRSRSLGGGAATSGGAATASILALIALGVVGGYMLAKNA